MYIKNIHINKFRHLENIHLGPFPKPADQSELIVVAGPNGGGKSSILELLGLALSTSWSVDYYSNRSMPKNASFEVAIAITPEEKRLIFEFIESYENTYSQDALDYLEANYIYYRAHNYMEGEYNKNRIIYDKVHDIIAHALRNRYSKTLGFLLGSDRHYPRKEFDRQRLFQYDEITSPNHMFSIAFHRSDVQYDDMYNFLVQQRFHYFQRLGTYQHRLDHPNRTEKVEKPSDPLEPYDELMQRLFPNYCFADKNEAIPSNLFIKLPSGEIIPFSDLSSGEKEEDSYLLLFYEQFSKNRPYLHLIG